MQKLRLIVRPEDEDLAREISTKLMEVYNIHVDIELVRFKLPEEAFNARRNQYDALKVVESMLWMKNLNELMLILTNEDLYVPGLNYCFGLAWKGVAIISSARLDQRFYNLQFDEELLKERAIKEACHEVGHLLGLEHCKNPRCVMHFSNWIGETDFKDYRPCSSCMRKLGFKA